MDTGGLHPGEDPVPLLAHRPDPDLLTEPFPSPEPAATRGTRPDPASRPGRPLRLSAILLELAWHSSASASTAAISSGPAGAPAPPLAPTHDAARPKVTLEAIFEHTRHAGFGFVIAFLALVSIPLAGLSFPFGIAIAGAGVQMIAARERAWLPRRVGRVAVPVRTIRWLGEKLGRWTRGLATLVRPRLGFASRGPFYALLGASVLLHGIGLSLPLIIPGSNWVFAIPLLIYGIGLLEDDGLLLLAGHAVTAAEIVLAVVFRNLVAESISKMIDWISSIL